MATAAKTESITKDQIEEFVKLEEERKALEQKARALGKRTSALADHFKAHLEAKKKTAITRSGYRITLVDGRPSVAWKDEFIKVAGPLAADDLLKSAPVSKRVDVQKV